jgi:hypothetical protein
MYNEDIDGKVRGGDGGWDRGAYEYSTTNIECRTPNVEWRMPNHPTLINDLQLIINDVRIYNLSGRHYGGRADLASGMYFVIDNEVNKVTHLK